MIENEAESLVFLMKAKSSRDSFGPANSPPAAPSARRMARATSYDVARLAGVSQSAVSRAFRDGGSISPDTRAKVERAARELGYAPSQIARSLITQRSRMIGVVMTELTARNYPDALHFLSHEIQATGNRMLLCSVPQDGEAAAGAADLLAFQVDGIISSASLPRETLEASERQGVPVVLYNRAPTSMLASAVACDHPTAMEALVEHLVAGGLKRAVFIAGPETAPVSNDRLLGVRTALAARGLALERVLHADYSYDGGRAIVAAHLTGASRPDTVICANDAMALGIMDAYRYDFGLRIPDDVAVAGFDDVPQAAWPSYALTTLRQPVRRMAQMTVRVLMEQISGTSDGRERRLLPAELKLRSSTRSPGTS
jgi:DNA-binding LacI/PurR family transcriptional regulator